MKSSIKGLLLATLLCSLGTLACAGASAQEYPHGGIIRAQTIVISPRWHGDRYYDGHRYWSHEEWERHHTYRRPPSHYDRSERHDAHWHG